MNSENIFRRRHLRKRRGIGTLWLILILPLAMILLCVVLEVGNLWLARQELEDSMEAAALAAVKQWADPPVVDTMTPREVGVQYAAANTAGGTPVTISTNYDNATGGVNQNAECDLTNIVGSDGILVFGAITDTVSPYTFNAGVQPSCGPTIVMDATANQLKDEGAWGISYQDDGGTGRTILGVLISLGGNLSFDLDNSGGFGPTLSTNGPGDYKVADDSGNEQPDNVLGGNTVLFFPPAGTATSSPTLLVFFTPGLAEGQRIRFGARVRDGNMVVDGDAIGANNSSARIFFNDSTSELIPYIDNDEFRKQDCLDPGDLTTVPGRVIVHPRDGGTVDLPCPPGAQPTNNFQSIAILGDSGGSGTGGLAYGVRAQAQKQVPSICGNLFGCSFGPFTVQAFADAQYDCIAQEPELIRVGTFICPGP